MHLLPTQSEVLQILKETGALRDGHFELPDGKHTNQFLQLPLALRYYQHARTLSVALSRLLRANAEVSAQISELSVVSPDSAGLPVAFGLSEALRCKQVYWTEMEADGHLRFRQYMEEHRGEKVIIADDILRTGTNLRELKAILEAEGATILALAVIIHQPYGAVHEFDKVPIYTLAKMEAQLFEDTKKCPMCRRGEPVEKVRMGWRQGA